MAREAGLGKCAVFGIISPRVRMSLTPDMRFGVKVLGYVPRTLMGVYPRWLVGSCRSSGKLWWDFSLSISRTRRLKADYDDLL